MKQNEEIRFGVCPRCGQSYTGRPALSRVDNETLICPDCGTREALATIGISVEEQEKILQVLHKTFHRRDEQ